MAVSHDTARRALLMRRANAAAGLSHPHLAALFEIDEDQGQLFLAIEYAPGEPLARFTAGRAINARRAVEIAAQVADAMAEAHASGVVHGDLKPENVVVTPKGRAKVLDAGLSEFTGGGAHRAAAPGVLAAGRSVPETTLLYTSPEQVLGEGVDHRTDIFSLGVILYEMLTGESPFRAPTAQALLLNVMQLTPPAPSARNPQSPRPLDGIVMRALAKGLDVRYQSMAEFAYDLRAIADALDARGAGLDEPSVVEPVGDHARRRRHVSVVLALAALAALAVIGWILSRGSTG
jgi:serine/threonine-protein kinase